MGKHMIPEELHEQMTTVGAEIGPLEAFAQAHGLVGPDVAEVAYEHPVVTDAGSVSLDAIAALRRDGQVK